MKLQCKPDLVQSLLLNLKYNALKEVEHSLIPHLDIEMTPLEDKYKWIQNLWKTYYWKKKKEEKANGSLP